MAPHLPRSQEASKRRGTPRTSQTAVLATNCTANLSRAAACARWLRLNTVRRAHALDSRRTLSLCERAGERDGGCCWGRVVAFFAGAKLDALSSIKANTKTFHFR